MGGISQKKEIDEILKLVRHISFPQINNVLFMFRKMTETVRSRGEELNLNPTGKGIRYDFYKHW